MKICTCCRENVPISDCSHGNDAVVDGGGDGGKAGVIVRVRLDVVAETPDQKTGDSHQEHEETKLLVAVLQGVGDGLETRGVSG